MSRKIWSLLIGAVIVLNILTSIWLFQLHRGNWLPNERAYSDLAGKRLPEVHLIDEWGRMVTVNDLAGQGKPTMFILFTPGDCPDCLEESSIWRLPADSELISITVICGVPEISEFQKWTKWHPIPPPVLFDTSFSIFEALHIDQTPLKLLIDDKGEIIWTDTPRLTADAKLRFMEDVRNAVAQIIH